MRVALVGAFPFPLPQGSQVFARDQARALTAAGASVTLLCYGRGVGPDPEGIEVVRVRTALSPAALRAGFAWRKPAADAALAAALVAAHRRRRFDAVLAHNVEAALAALAARPALGAPVAYVAHTLMGHELGSHGPPRLARVLDRAGDALDGLVARGASGVIALCGAAAESLRPRARGPVALIPPGLTPARPPDEAAVARICAEHGVEPGGFALYAGNLDRYQDLDALDAAARALPGIPVLAATHARPTRRGFDALRVTHLDAHPALRALTAAAGVAVLPRRRPGGFPIKLLNYMEAGRAIVARAGVAEGLVHGHTAWLVPPQAGPDQLAAAIRELLGDPIRAAKLGAAARAHLEAAHAWPALAQRTLDFLGELAAARRP